MVVVKKKKGETEDKLIARFRKLSSGKIADYKEKIRYEKPSERRYKQNKRIKHLIELEKEKN
jgi:ribosomal protein S21